MDKWIAETISKLRSISLLLSLYIITVVTLYYHKFSIEGVGVEEQSQIQAMYHIITLVFGRSLFGLFNDGIASKLTPLKSYGAIAMIGIFVYIVLNLSYSINALIGHPIPMEIYYPNIESYAMAIFSITSSFMYIKWADNKMNIFLNKASSWLKIHQ